MKKKEKFAKVELIQASYIFVNINYVNVFHHEFTAYYLITVLIKKLFYKSLSKHLIKIDF